MQNWVEVEDGEWENEKTGATIRIWDKGDFSFVMYEEWETDGVSALFKSKSEKAAIKYAMKFMKSHPIIKPRSIKEHPSVWR